MHDNKGNTHNGYVCNNHIVFRFVNSEIFLKQENLIQNFDRYHIDKCFVMHKTMQ